MKTIIHTLTEIKVSMFEPCEYNVETYINNDNIEDIFNKKVNGWIDEVQKNIEDNGEEFDFESWAISSLTTNIDNAYYKCKHFIYKDGEEKIFELKANYVEQNAA